MMHPATQAELKKWMDRAIGTSKTWSTTAHKAFEEMATKAHDDVVLKGDFSFLWQFRKEFGITTQVPPLNGYVPESQFSTLLLSISQHFNSLAQEYERTNKRSMYLDMLRSGRKDEFIQIMRGVQKEREDKMKANAWSTDTTDSELLQKVWQEFNAEEQARQRQQQEEENRARLASLRALKQQQAIEAEAKRRIEQEKFEAAVAAKVQELKGSR
jgi:hypothetical protein